MGKALEEDLRQLFAEDALQAPHAFGLAERAQGAARRRRSRLLQTACVASLAGAMALMLAVVVANAPAHHGAPSGHTPLLRHGPLPDKNQGFCAVAYSPSAVAERAFAFDGVVESIQEPSQDSNELAKVTFSIRQWFEGGEERTFTIRLTPPAPKGATDELPPSYEVGTRLLVSGDYASQNSDPEPTGLPCGFTRYYDEPTADSWSRSTARG